MGSDGTVPDGTKCLRCVRQLRLRRAWRPSVAHTYRLRCAGAARRLSCSVPSAWSWGWRSPPTAHRTASRCAACPSLSTASCVTTIRTCPCSGACSWQLQQLLAAAAAAARHSVGKPLQCLRPMQCLEVEMARQGFDTNTSAPQCMLQHLQQCACNTPPRGKPPCPCISDPILSSPSS
jgi:hypothetical protein